MSGNNLSDLTDAAKLANSIRNSANVTDIRSRKRAEGGRNNALYKFVRDRRDENLAESIAWELAQAENASFQPPLPEREVKQTFRSAWSNEPQITGNERYGRIVVRAGGLPEAVDAALDLLIPRSEEAGLYVSAGALVRPFTVQREGFVGVDGRSEIVDSLEMCRVSLTSFRVEMTRLASFVHERKVKGGDLHEFPIDCPETVAKAIYESPDRLRDLPQIERLSEVPLFDGQVLFAEPGLHRGAWVNAPAGVALTADLSERGAKAALQRVQSYLAEFPFDKTDVSAAVAVALMMTAALRPSLATAPGFMLSKPSYGAGATMLATMAGIIATGRMPPVMPFSRREEGVKQLNAALINGTTVLVLDNLPEGQPLSDPLLGQVLSQTQVQVRELGTGRTPIIDTRRLVIATGVNVSVADDLVRRMVTCRIDPQIERPESRVFKRPDLLEELRANRISVLSDLFSVTAAYLRQKGRTPTEPLSGYDQWVRWVAEPLAWLGLGDVVVTSRAAAGVDGTTILIQQLLPLIEQLHQRRTFAAHAGLSTKAILMKGDKPRHEDEDSWWALRGSIHAVLAEATRAKTFNDAPQLDPVAVAYWLKRIKQRVVNGQRLIEAGRGTGQAKGQPLWKVERMTANQGVSP